MTPRRRDAAAFVLVGLALAIVGWNELRVDARSGLDPSWGAGLHMAGHHDLAWGREIVFTFGPLGFLRDPTFWYSGSAALAVLYTLATRVALAGALWWFGRRTFGSVGAALVALVVVPLVSNPLASLVFGWALWMLLGEERTRRQWTAFAAGAGVLGGIELLGKINLGVLLVALGAVAVAFAPRDRLRLAAVYAGASAGGLLLGWIATGQRLLDVNDYLVNAARVAGGYSSAMLFTDPGGKWEYTAALVLFALAAYGVWTAAPPGRTRARLGALALTLTLSFVAFKSGFVRHDPAHALEYFGVLLPALVVIPYRADLRRFGLAAVAAAFLTILPIASARLDDIVAPLDRAGAAWNDVTLVARPGERARLRDDGRERLRGFYRLDGAVLEALAGQTVHVDPYETAVAWAYELDWRPLPVFHSYQAYTAGLDRLNADALLASDAPGRVLVGRQPTVDNRVGAWESPAAFRAMLCRYQPLVARDPWLVLGRGADRCGPERPLTTETARWRESVPVPPAQPDAMVIVRIEDAGPGLWERGRSTLFKGYERTVNFGDGVDRKLVPGTAESGLLLHAPPGVDLPEGFVRAPAPKTISVRREGDPGGTVRYRFALVPLRP